MSYWVPLGVDPSLIRFWDDVAIAFNRLSGQTHLLNPLAVEILLLIVEGKRSTDDLERAVSELVGEAPAEGWRDHVGTFLAELQELGLIAQASA